MARSTPLPRPLDLNRRKARNSCPKEGAMNRAWMDARFALDFYQDALTLVVWLLAAFTCLGALAALAYICRECILSKWSGGHPLKHVG